MARQLNNWIEQYLGYAGIGEAPKRMHFWVAVSTIAGALRRRVWINQTHFTWYPNFYIILVAPPGVISKTTTANIGMKLLREVPGVCFGADVITAQALVGDFASALERFEADGEERIMSPLTFSSGEFGNLLDPQDKVMIDLLVSLWDGNDGAFKKRTKTSGNDEVVNPWINLIACTTPSWIASNFPEYMIGGGFVSRCVFVYAEDKERVIAYPDEQILDAKAYAAKRASLISDLTHISQLAGAFTIHESARVWGRAWYADLWQKKPGTVTDDRYSAYLARKWTHMHKVAMILSVAECDDLLIVKDHLELACEMVTDLEQEMGQVFNRIGRSSESLSVDRLLGFIAQKGVCTMSEATRYVHNFFPSGYEFEQALSGAIKAGYVELRQTPMPPSLIALPPLLDRFKLNEVQQ